MILLLRASRMQESDGYNEKCKSDLRMDEAFERSERASEKIAP
jgi:hypothetical protein